MTKFKVIKDKDAYAIYKCWLWKIQDENGMTVSPIFASKQKAEEFLQELSK